MATDGTARPRRWLWPALMLSLMVNFLVIGAVAGVVLASRGGGWGWHGHDDKGLTGFIGNLPPARSTELGNILEAEHKRLGPLWADLGRTRRDVIEGVAVEPFERAKLEALLARFGEADSKIREGRMRKFAEVVSAMTAEERHAFRDWRQSKRRGWWPWRRDWRARHEEGAQ